MPATATTETTETEGKHPLARFSAEQLDELAREFETIHERVKGELGERDRLYVERIIKLQRGLVAAGRLALLASRRRTAWLGGAGTLALSKTIGVLELDHNVLHGQWDWMNDPRVHSSTWEWDGVTASKLWKHSHNYVHHTYTNVRDLDKDIGYRILRIDPEQEWKPVYLLQPVLNLALMLFFELGMALHGFEFEAALWGNLPKDQLKREMAELGKKAKGQATREFVAWPLVSAAVAAAVAVAREAAAGPKPKRRRFGGRSRARFDRRGVLARALADGAKAYRSTATANAAANVLRNIWLYATIFCGHFTDETYTFSRKEIADESRGAWYVRQLLGTANIEGSRAFHVSCGHLGYQIEHHLFPDVPSNRYAEIAPEVKDVCERYGLPYNSGRLGRQLAAVQRTILRLTLPGGKPTKKPGPFKRAE